ncbi:hypothetical protein A4S06_11645 [Erysipelotrichaceae bacterium MTC7]|nr:hypothetical protein A4S06_11645 [Erysipelotrichaceae bacterium MTC7]
MQYKIKQCADEIKTNAQFIRDVREIYEEPFTQFDVCTFFDVVQNYSFIPLKNREDIQVPSKYESNFEYKGEITLISIEELISSFSYGLDTLDDILYVKNVYGSIDALKDNL